MSKQTKDIERRLKQVADAYSVDDLEYCIEYTQDMLRVLTNLVFIKKLEQMKEVWNEQRQKRN